MKTRKKIAKEQTKQICVYCLSRVVTSVDHVPNKSMFPSPKPSDLITVPSCFACNQGFQRDEEYFLGVITFTEAGVSQEAKKLWDQKLGRMYTKNKGLRRAIANSLGVTQLVTPAGLYLGRRFAVEPDWKRIRNYFNKIVKGLYYFEFNQPLPSSVEIRSLMLTDKQKAEEVNANVAIGQRGWKGVFEYKRNRLPNSPADSLWLFLIYDTLLFGAASYGKEEDNQNDEVGGTV
jgi:hypothetical protein